MLVSIYFSLTPGRAKFPHPVRAGCRWSVFRPSCKTQGEPRVPCWLAKSPRKFSCEPIGSQLTVVHRGRLTRHSVVPAVDAGVYAYAPFEFQRLLSYFSRLFRRVSPDGLPESSIMTYAWHTKYVLRSKHFSFSLFFFIPFIVLALLSRSLPVRDISCPGSHSGPSSPLPTTVRAFIFIARIIQHFLPSWTVRNTVRRKIQFIYFEVCHWTLRDGTVRHPLAQLALPLPRHHT